MSTRAFLNHLQTYTDGLLERHQVPAISIAIWHEGELHRAAAGILNIDTGVTATPASVFRIGSITKVITASLVMQLVDAGRIELDAPVNRYLRDFRVADAEASERITVRQLLNHTSGMAGDLFPDDYRESGNPIARYVDRCQLLPQIHPPGQRFSYCNAGYTVAGRLVEVVLGMPWWVAVDECVFRPLGMRQAVACPLDLLRYRAAIGHLATGDKDRPWALPEVPYLSLGGAPAGSTLNMSASDLITFARAHVNAGATASGDAWLSPNAIAQMQTPSVPLPRHSTNFVTHWGLGWQLMASSSAADPFIGHDGFTAGQNALLRIIPSRDIGLVVMTNAFKSGVLPHIFSEVMQALIGWALGEPTPLTQEVDPRPFPGRFESLIQRFDITLDHQGLVAVVHNKILRDPPQTLRLKPLAEDAFIVVDAAGAYQGNWIFLDKDVEGRPLRLLAGNRLHQREAVSSSMTTGGQA